MTKRPDSDTQFSDDQSSDVVGSIVDGLTSSRLFGDALTRLVDAGERVVHVQQTAFSAVGLPSGQQFEALALRVRTVFHRIEELEDDIDRLERRVVALEKQLVKPAPVRRTTPKAKSTK